MNVAIQISARAKELMHSKSLLMHDLHWHPLEGERSYFRKPPPPLQGAKL